MAKLTDVEIVNIVGSEESQALDYQGQISTNRAMLMDYYNGQPYGDEQDGQSQAVTSDVADVVEWMLPGLVRKFTQSKTLARFNSNQETHDQEAKDKTILANHVFFNENPGVLTLTNQFKDSLLQYTGTVKVYWEDVTNVSVTNYSGMSEFEYQKLLATEGVEVDELEVVEIEDADGLPIKRYNAKAVKRTTSGSIQIDNIPPEEFLIAKSARDFDSPRFIGHRSPKSRSDLIKMGFDVGVVSTLPADEHFDKSEQKNARNHNLDQSQDSNASNHHPNDIIYLGEYYQEMDVDGDGVTELWKVFFAGSRVLEKTQVREHPFCTVVPVPIPHRAIGTCPAEQTADLQYRKSVLVRQMLDNVYQTNYPRVLTSNQVELDDLLSPRPGANIGVDTDAPDVAGHAHPFVIPTMTDSLLQAIEYTDREREIRTGMTRYSQGLDGESLNDTATGFLGIREDSRQRRDLIALLFAEGGVRRIFERIISLLGENQKTSYQLKVAGRPLEINPIDWSENLNCSIDIGFGAGDRQERVVSLNALLAIQERLIDKGSVLSDQRKMFKTLDKLTDEIGLKEANIYFNDPEVKEDTLFAENQFLTGLVKQLQAQMQNPLAEAEMVKVQGKIASDDAKNQNSMRQFILKMAQEDKQFAAELSKELTELELKYKQDVPGATI